MLQVEYHKPRHLLHHIYKRKGDRACCDNHRGISLLSTAGKVLGRVILNRLSSYVFVRRLYLSVSVGLALVVVLRT